MQFIYAIPDFPRQQITPAELDAIGLDHMHGGEQPVAMRLDRVTLPGAEQPGPALFVGAVDGVAGPDTPADVRYVPAEQTWRPGVRRDGKPLFYVGHWTASRPTPAALLRAKAIGGRDVELRDGTVWRVPVAEAEFGNATLPLLMDFDDTAQRWLGRPGPEYAALLADARRAYGWLENAYFAPADQKQSIVFDDAMGVVVTALAANYRVSAVEIAALGLIGQPEMWRVLETLCDWPSLIEMLSAKKKPSPASV